MHFYTDKLWTRLVLTINTLCYSKYLICISKINILYAERIVQHC
jgi:hypothetical protein